MSFLHPTLLFGALLFAVPLIIHLLNRQRYKRREWAAMDFLLRAYKKQRRRLRTENILLLLLRCLIPVVVAFAIARPMLDAASSPLAASTAHHVLVLDASYSTGMHPDSAQSPFARMRDLATELVDRLEEPAGNRVTLVLAGVRPRIPLQEVLDLGRVKARLAAETAPPDSAGDLSEALGQVAELLERSEGEAVVYLLTDLQHRAFGSEADADPDEAQPDAAPADGFRDTLDDHLLRIRDRAELIVLDAGGVAHEQQPARVDNVQLTDLRLGVPVALANSAVPVVARVRNRCDVTRTVQVTLELEGEQPSVRGLRLEAGAEGEVEFTAAFRTAGEHHLRARLEDDALAADNARHLVIRVRERIRVLLVEGSAERDPDLMDGGHLWQVLDPTQGEGDATTAMFAVEVATPLDLLADRLELEDYDVVVLANVERLNEAAADRLAAMVAGGGALWVMLGDAVDPASYNLHLHGRGLMPMELTGVHGYTPGGDSYYTAEIAQPDHPIFAEGFIEDVYYSLFELTPVYRCLASTHFDAEAGQILARLHDDARTPLVVAAGLGGGKALFWTSPVSRRQPPWNRFDLGVMAFPLFHETAKWLVLPSGDPFNVSVGAALGCVIDGKPANAFVLPPERAGGGKVSLATESRTLEGGRFALPAFRDTRHAGVYTVELDVERDGVAEAERLYFAVDVDPAEGDLVFLSHAAARERLGVQTILRDLPSDRGDVLHSGNHDFGILLLWVALAVLIGEALMARFVQRRRA